MRLKDKVAIVTGAGSGFGEGIARRFAAEGARVVVADINDEGGRRVADGIGGDAAFVHADVTIGDQVAAMVATAVEGFGGLDILVNNAGMPQRNMPMLEVSEDAFDRIFAVNVKALYLAALHAVPVFRARGGHSRMSTIVSMCPILVVIQWVKPSFSRRPGAPMSTNVNIFALSAPGIAWPRRRSGRPDGRSRRRSGPDSP